MHPFSNKKSSLSQHSYFLLGALYCCTAVHTYMYDMCPSSVRSSSSIKPQFIDMYFEPVIGQCIMRVDRTYSTPHTTHVGIGVFLLPDESDPHQVYIVVVVGTKMQQQIDEGRWLPTRVKYLKSQNISSPRKNK